MTDLLSFVQAVIAKRVGTPETGGFPEFGDHNEHLSWHGTFSWEHYYVDLRLTSTTDDGDPFGGLNYSGVNHPNEICEGNPCFYCGCVW